MEFLRKLLQIYQPLTRSCGIKPVIFYETCNFSSLLPDSFALDFHFLYNKYIFRLLSNQKRGSAMSRRCASIRARVILLSLAFTALIALSVCVGSLIALYNSTTRATAQTVEYNLQIAANTLYQGVEEIDTLADWCTVDNTVRGFVLSTYPQRQLLDVYNLILNKYSSQHTARYLRRFLVTDGSTRIMQQGTATAQSLALTAETLPLLPCYDGLKSDSWTTLATDPLITAGSREIIPVIRTLSSSSTGAGGRVYIGVSSAFITDTVADYMLLDGCQLFWIMGGQVYAVENGSLSPLETVQDALGESDAPRSFELLDQRTRVYSYADQTVLAYPVGSHDLYIAQTLPRTVIMSQLPNMLVPLLGALVAILLLGLILGILLRQMISTPVLALQAQLRRIGEGDFAPNPAIEWNNEMGDIGRGINGLSRSITALMERRLEDERQKKDLEYRMLQNQINPHFIYNTLNSIKWMATIQHAPGIAEMTMALSRLLKSVSKGNERLVPLQEEFALLNDYFTIQQYRYGGTITLDVTYIEDERLCRDCMIPRFTLQPLVENAIFHGIEPKGCAGSIALTVAHDPANRDVLISLTDDGVGMTAEQAARALTEPGPEEAAAKFRHVGMWNVHRRLQYSFGEGYGLAIQSQPGQGTTVTVRLPGAPTGKEPL